MKVTYFNAFYCQFLFRFILSSELEPEESFDEFNEDAEEIAKEREQEHRRGLLKQVDFNRWVHVRYCGLCMRRCVVCIGEGPYILFLFFVFCQNPNKG